MGEKFYPDRFLKQVMPKSFYTQGLVSKNFTLQKGAISAINRARLATGRPIDKTVYDVLLQYKAKYKDLIAAEDFGKTQAFEAALNGENLLRQRIEQAVIFDKIQDLKAQHKGEFYRWMPSSAENPDPQHGLLYGKIFRVGEGDKEGNMPGERYGCQCGIEWISDGEYKQDKILQHTPASFVKKVEEMFNDATQKRNLTDASKYIVFGKIKGKQARRLLRDTGIDFKGFQYQLRTKDMRHGILEHGDMSTETARNQRPVTAKDYALIPHITRYYDNVIVQKRKAGLRLKFIKKIGNEYSYVVAVTNPKKGKGAFFINKTLFVGT